MSRCRLTPEQRARITTLAEQGIGPSVIARELGLKPSQIENTRRRLIRAGRAPMRPRPPHKRWTAKETDRLIDLIEQGVAYIEIAHRFKRTETSIRLRCKRIGVLTTTTRATMSARNAAAALGVACSKTITTWIRRGWLIARNAGAHGRTLWRIAWEDLTTFLENPAYWIAWRPDRIPDLALREWAQELRTNETPLITQSVIAERFHVCRETVAQWIDKGWLPSVRYNNRKVPETALDGWVVPCERAAPIDPHWPREGWHTIGRTSDAVFRRCAAQGEMT